MGSILEKKRHTRRVRSRRAFAPVRGLSLQGITTLESMGSSDSIEVPGSDKAIGRTLGVDEDAGAGQDDRAVGFPVGLKGALR